MSVERALPRISALINFGKSRYACIISNIPDLGRGGDLEPVRAQDTQATTHNRKHMSFSVNSRSAVYDRSP
eukprot:7526403-Pyramimonas_sp.AAC.1